VHVSGKVGSGAAVWGGRWEPSLLLVQSSVARASGDIPEWEIPSEGWHDSVGVYVKLDAPDQER
jgi:hypothetical protein